MASQDAPPFLVQMMGVTHCLPALTQPSACTSISMRTTFPGEQVESSSRRVAAAIDLMQQRFAPSLVQITAPVGATLRAPA